MVSGGGTAGTRLTIPVRYTCDGTNTTPSFRWGAVPPSTAQLALFLFKIGPSVSGPGSASRVEATIEWAVAGLFPSIHEIPAGRLPHGAVAGSKRYSICPAKGEVGNYVFQLNALSHPLAVKPHFEANTLFRDVESLTVASGVFTSSYKRT